MLKKLLKYSCFSLVLLIAACAPKPRIAAPPPIYMGVELSLEEIISKAGNDKNVLKAIADINVDKNNGRHDSVNASVLVKKPGMVHIRAYKLGMLVSDFVFKDGEFYTLAGKNTEGLKKFGSEFYNTLFWWDNLKEGILYTTREHYIIRSKDREIRLDRATLLPVSQEVKTSEGRIAIKYDTPEKNAEGLWYPSVITIDLNQLKFIVMIKKIIENPQPGEFDFRVPGE